MGEKVYVYELKELPIETSTAGDFIHSFNISQKTDLHIFDE